MNCPTRMRHPPWKYTEKERKQREQELQPAPQPILRTCALVIFLISLKINELARGGVGARSG